MPRFIVLSGKKQAGKTTVANLIKIYINSVRPDLLVQITSFATPIKQFCEDVLGLSKAQIFGSNEDKNSDTYVRWDRLPKEIQARYGYPHVSQAGVTPKPATREFLTAREVMQIFGTDIMRACFDYDIWAKAPFNKSWGATDVVIIDDCRFPNEADVGLEHKAFLIRLMRNPLEDTHISEIAMDDYDITKYDYIVDNRNLSLKELDILIGRIMHKRAGYTK
jgi:hypothetical protein